MRVATWNLERGGRSMWVREAQEQVLREHAADIVVLTEPGPTYAGRSDVVLSTPSAVGRGTEPWVALVGASVERVALDTPHERLAAAAVVRGRLLVYGSVLPWNAVRAHAPEITRAGESAEDVFLRVLREQVDDMRRLSERYARLPLFWAGDFNQTLSGPNHGGSAVKRRALVAALAELDLRVWNADAAHAQDGMHAIDLLCGSPSLQVLRAGRIAPTRDGVTLSDHAGYWVDLL